MFLTQVLPCCLPALAEPRAAPAAPHVGSGGRAGGPGGFGWDERGVLSPQQPLPCPPDPWGSLAATGAGKVRVNLLGKEPHPSTCPAAFPWNRRWLNGESVPKKIPEGGCWTPPTPSVPMTSLEEGGGMFWEQCQPGGTVRCHLQGSQFSKAFWGRWIFARD